MSVFSIQIKLLLKIQEIACKRNWFLTPIELAYFLYISYLDILKQRRAKIYTYTGFTI